MENIKYTFFSQEDTELKRLYGEQGDFDKLEQILMMVVRDHVTKFKKTSKIQEGAEIEVVVPSIKLK
jgi:hypothetical protein